MKKLKKFLIISACMGGMLWSGSVNAASLSFNSSTAKDNTVTIPISFSVSESDEEISSVQFGCVTDNDDVTCEIVAESSNIIETKGTSYNLYSYNGDGVTNYPKGTTIVANLMLTNTKPYAINSNNLKVQLNNISYTKSEGTVIKYTDSVPSKSVSIKAKPEEKVTSSDATLSDVSVSQGTIAPVFNKDIYEYTVYGIKDTINSIKFTTTCSEGECSPVLSGGKSVSNKTVTLAQGENKVSIVVTSQDYSKSVTYNFNVIRGDTPYNSAKLSSLTFGSYNLNVPFEEDTTEYTLTIPYELNNLLNTVKYTTADTNATAELKGADELKVGENTLTIDVTNVMKDTIKTYTVTVTRLPNESITIKKYISDEVTYQIGEETKTLKINEFKLYYVNEYNKIINNEYNFDEEGNLIDKPIAEPTTEPVTEPIKEQDKKDNNLIIIIAIIGGGLAIIIFSAILIFKKKPENKESNKEKLEEEIKPATKVIDQEMDMPLQNTKMGETQNHIGDDFTDDLTVSVEDALNDLMNTKQYSFKDIDDDKNEE